MASKRIAEIKPYDYAEPLQIRVLNQWIPYKRNELCYLFVDIEGNAIEAVGNLDQQSHFAAKISLNHTYIVSNYLSDKARPTMNVVPHPACLKIGTGTSFVPLQCNDIPVYYFNFATYDQLKPRQDNHFLLTDYIGRMVKVTDIIHTTTDKNMLKINLQDQRNIFIETTLWEEKAFSFNREKALNTQQPVIIALTAMKVTDFRGIFTYFLFKTKTAINFLTMLGNLQLGSTNATTVEINPAIDDLAAIIDSFQGISDICGTSAGTQLAITERNNEQHNITLDILLKKNPKENQGITFTCLASISELKLDGKWFYNSCTQCKKQLIPKGDKKGCTNHGVIEEPRYMFCVNATLSDNTSSTTVVLFNEAVTNLLGMNCYDMIVKAGYTDQDIIPKPLYKIRGKTKVFQLQFQNENKEGKPSLKVNRVFEPTLTTDNSLTINDPYSTRKTTKNNTPR